MSRPNKGRKSIERLADMLVEDVLNTSDEDLLREFSEEGGDPEQFATEMRELFDTTVLRSNKQRMAAAKAGVAANRQKSRTAVKLHASDARRRLRTILSNPNVPAGLTLAARNESELSDADVLGMLEDLKELGFPPEDDAN